ncbi:hypothetical protein H1C71_037577, partial [Ictidomys tridecemlineatus]
EHSRTKTGQLLAQSSANKQVDERMKRSRDFPLKPRPWSQGTWFTVLEGGNWQMPLQVPLVWRDRGDSKEPSVHRTLSPGLQMQDDGIVTVSTGLIQKCIDKSFIPVQKQRVCFLSFFSIQK